MGMQIWIPRNDRHAVLGEWKGDHPPPLATGLSTQHRMLIVWHTEQNDTVRILGAREVTPWERRTYESGE